MSQNKGAAHCPVCRIKLPSQADLVLHEFSDKHCENLLKTSKNKPIKIKTPKPKKSDEAPTEATMEATVSDPAVQPTGSITMYGYFLPEEVGKHDLSSYGYANQEYDYNYDPYKQKLAENPFKPPPPPPQPAAPVIQTANITSFARKKKKKKQKTCQICNITLLTVPEYEAHMKSPQHVWKLKVTGMGVSAHFVKASTDLHTTEAEDEVEEDTTQVPVMPTPTPIDTVPSLIRLFCETCELLLNSDQQYNIHLSSKSHQDQVKRKAELKAKKEKQATPVPNQLYCYSCQLPLNNLQQYNEHRNGKKHLIRCRQLIRQGITIPPEERTNSLPLTRVKLNSQVVYPELYEKYILQGKTEESKIVELKKSEEPKTVEFKIPEEPKLVKFKRPQEPKLIEFKKPEEPKSAEIKSVKPSHATYCYVCEFGCNTEVQYELHLNTKSHFTKLGKLECRLCNIKFQTQKAMVEHNKELHEKQMSQNVSNTVKESCIVFHNVEKNRSSAKGRVEINNDTNNKNEGRNSAGTSEKHDTLSDKCNKDTGMNSGQVERSNEKVSEVALAKVATRIDTPCHKYLCNACQEVLSLNSSQAEEHLMSTKHLECLKQICPRIKCVKSSTFSHTKCEICQINFHYPIELDFHNTTLQHVTAVAELKLNNTSDSDIIVLLYSNLSKLEELKFTRYPCSLCSVTSNNLSEYKQHLSSLVHKLAFQKHRQLKLLEISEATKPDEDGKYTCKICKVTVNDILEYNNHSHSLIHKYTKKAINAKKFRKKKLRLGIRKKGLGLNHWRVKYERNPGVRTKISGTAADLQTGSITNVPNLETLEPKIDRIKNVQLGITVDETPAKKAKIVTKEQRSQRRPFQRFQSYNNVPPCYQTLPRPLLPAMRQLPNQIPQLLRPPPPLLPELGCKEFFTRRIPPNSQPYVRPPDPRSPLFTRRRPMYPPRHHRPMW